ncbi:MAG TPA: LptF/LptG family permease [Anaeromyxobacteraceae bacterium]|nr:LptF/LptG family permease [Anaeromyxobacteraceae bacterium]
MRLFRHIATRALVAFVGSLGGVVALFLVVEFAENASLTRVEGWLAPALELYANRAAIVVWQLAPAAMLLAAAITASGLRKTREYTAMRALGLGPWRVALPVAAVAGAVGLALAGFGDRVVVRAAERADQILAEKFGQRNVLASISGERKQWFRGKDGRRIFDLRSGGEGGAYERVTILELTPEFRLARRIDAARMAPAAQPGGWRLEGVEERSFDGSGAMALARYDVRVYTFDEDPAAFQVRPGRPSQLTRAELVEQVAARQRIGLPTTDFAIEWHRRLAYPLAGLPAGLVALALALRRERKGHLTAALMEAIGVSFVFWAVEGIAASLGHSGRLPPAAAAWLPDAIFLAIGAFALRRLA